MINALAADPVPRYGAWVGFGALASRHIPPQSRARLQVSLVRSHAGPARRWSGRWSGRGLCRLRADAEPGDHPGRAGVRQLGLLGDLAPRAACALALTGDTLAAAENLRAHAAAVRARIPR